MPHPVLQQAIKRSSELIETNNSAGSRVSDQLYSILESGEGSTEIRDLLDQALHNFATTNLTNANPQYNWDNLRKLTSIKDKIAYLTACYHENMTAGPALLTADSIINDDALRTNLDEVIQFLEQNLISNRDFTESWMLRHAAFNRFEAGLTAKESSSLNIVASELKTLCETNGYDNLAQSTHFTKESDAQKIMKLGQVAKELSAHGTKIPDSILSQLEPLDKKVEPLKKLNIGYKHMINMLNMIHSIPKGYPSMINQSEQKKLTTILEKLGKKESDFIIKPRETIKTDEFMTLEEFHRGLVNHQDFGKTLEEIGVTENDFQKWFLVYFTYRNSEIAKENLDGQKKRTFGNREKDYEQDVQQRRGRLRNRVFEIGERMHPVGGGTTARDSLWGGERAEFANNQDYELANSYFSKFQNLFFVNERDSYRGNGEDGTTIDGHYINMRNTIAAILRRKMPALCTGGHDRHGSFPRKMYKRLEWMMKGQEEKGFFKMIKRTWHNADHAEMMAMIIMLNNQQQQKMFHSPKNPFKHNDGFFGKLFRGLHFTEKYRQKIGKKIAPAAKTFLKMVEGAGKTLIGKPIVSGAEKYNNSLKKYKRYKTPFYALLPVTWILAKGRNAYHGTQKYLSNLKGEQVNEISSALVDATDAVTGMVGKTVSYAGGASYDKYKTNQQRGVLSTFFELACEDEKRRELVQSNQLSEIFNFQNRETYLFDEDGRVDMIDKKPDDCGEVKAGKALAKKIQEQLEQLQRGIDDQEDFISRQLENTTDKYDLLRKKTNLEARKGDILDIRIRLEQLIPVIKDPTNTQNQRTIENIIGEVNPTIVPPNQANVNTTYTGLKGQLNNLLTNTRTRRNNINSYQTIQGFNDNDRIPYHENIRQTNRTQLENATANNVGLKRRLNQYINNNANNINQGNIDQIQLDIDTNERTIRNAESAIKTADSRINQLIQELMELDSRESRLRRVSTFINTIRDNQNNLNIDNQDTLNSLINSLDLTLYKPSQTPQPNQASQQPAGNPALALTP